MVMAHGDGIWSDSRKFRFLRRLFRNRFCQRLFASIHPRWTVPFAYAWSNHSRVSGSAPHVIEREEGRMKRNLEGLRAFCEKYLQDHPDCRYFLFGHLHKLIRQPITESSEMIVLGDWLKIFSYAEFDGEKMTLHQFEPTVSNL